MSLKKKVIRGIKILLSGQPIKKVYPQIVTLSPNSLLKGRVALVTGGTSGIGKEIARAFVNAGATVVITGRSEERLKQACSDIMQSLGKSECVYGVELDNTDVLSFQKKLDKIHDLLGKKNIDILVNNAGVRGGHIGKTTEEEYDTIMDTNLKGVFFFTELIVREMIENGIQGNILNIASASCARPAISAYHISKWGIRGLTQGLARSLAPFGICVNAIAPGPTATPMLGKGNDEKDISHPRNLIGRYATPEEIANMAVILVSDMSRTIIGDTIFMSGGGGIITNEDVDFKF
ncbi:MAG: SDR family oxidoreductase [Prevotella sp.]|jgi:3-oxoacyl-[acyl-carrier protein] reductase|nr:SDR family oxidoreductase [Prevotella sp.]